MRLKDRKSLPVIMVTGALAVGLLGTALWSAERSLGGASLPLSDLTRMEPIRVLPRAELMLVAMEARAQIEAGRPWAAWEMMRERLDEPESAPGEAVITAAAAAGGWGGWRHVRPLLEGQPWLAEVGDGEGLFLLARASEEMGDRDRAVAEYRRYARVAEGRRRGVALARMGGLLRAEGDARAAAGAFAGAAAELPQIQDWLVALEAEQRAKAGDASAVSVARRGSAGSAPVRLRRVEAEVAGLLVEGRRDEALLRLEREAKVLRAQGAAGEAARLDISRSRLLGEQGQHASARDLLRAVAWDVGAPGAVRSEAAGLLAEMAGVDADDHLARVAALEAAGRPGHAARALRSALAAGAPDGAGVRLRLARLLYEERDYGPAREAFVAAADLLDEPELAADARLHAARSLFRTGSAGRARALAEIREVAERYPGTAAAGSAWYLLGDEAATTAGALALYRRAAAVTHSPDAREALYRVGHRSLRLDDIPGAIRAWESYVERYPRGDQTAEVAYETGKLHERAGRDAAARAMYRAAMEANPISYYAVLASDRLGVDPLGDVLLEPRPWPGLAADPVVAGNVLRRLDVLAEVGLSAEWRAELDAAVRGLADRPSALLALGEGLRDRDRALDAIRIGHRLHEARGGEWDEHTLRLVFPFPYRRLIEAESSRAGVDPSLLAGLIRQESTFRPSIKSWVGATGLGQVMPATGRWLAPSVGIRNYEDLLLEVPEVNVRMSAKYLGDLVKRYDGARDLALAGYNAGPGRADRWRRSLASPDRDVFRDRIPFDETRHYVKVVIRNAAIYERLYGNPPATGLVRRMD